MSQFSTNPGLDASIEIKVTGAYLGNPFNAKSMTPEDVSNFRNMLDMTAEEQEYLAAQSLYRMVQASVGKIVIDTLTKHNCRVKREDLVPSLEAYFEAVDAGKHEAIE